MRRRGMRPCCRVSFATSAIAIAWTGRASTGEPREYTGSVRIAIDARKLHDFGIGTYIRNLVRGLAKIDQATEYVLLCQEQDMGFAATLGPNFRAVPERAGHYSIA